MGGVQEENEGTAAIARRAYEAFNRGGVEAILEFLDPQIEWHMWERFARKSRVFHGHDGVRTVLSLFDENLDDFRADPKEFIVAGKRMVVPVRLHGRAKGTREKQSFELVQVWSTRDNRSAHRLDVYSDLDEALEALGGVKPGSHGGATGRP